MAVVVLSAASCGDDDVRFVEGVTTAVDTSGIGIGVGADVDDQSPEGYVVGNGVEWIGTDGSLRETGQPECMPPLSLGAQVRLHVVTYDGRAQVVRVECHSLPTELYGAGEQGASPYRSYCEGRDRTGQVPEAVVDDPCVDD